MKDNLLRLDERRDMDKQKALAKEEVERAQAAAHFSQVPTAKP